VERIQTRKTFVQQLKKIGHLERQLTTSSHIPQPSVRAAIYARYSSDLQRPASIEDQTRNCRVGAEANGWTVLEDFVRADSAQSGAALLGRHSLNSLIADAKKHPRPIDCVLMDDTSRLGRNLADVLRVSDILKHYGVFLFFVSQKLDSRETNFRQLLTMNGMMDEQLLSGLSDKVHRGQEGRVLNGFHTGGTRRGRYGRPAVIGVRREIVEEESSVVRRIFESYANGYSLSRIAKMLNSEGIPSQKRSYKGFPRAWYPTGIREMLHNEQYRGVQIWNRTHRVRNPETGRREKRRRPESDWVRKELPEQRIISEELWTRVHRQLALMNEKWGIKKMGGYYRTGESSKYLFSGLLVCGLCGGRMTIIGSEKGGRRARYGCFAHRYLGLCANALCIGREILEEQLIERITNRLRRPDMLERALRGFQEELRKRLNDRRSAARAAAGRSGELQNRLGLLLKQADNICDAIAANGHRNSPSLLSRLSATEAEIEHVKSRLAEAQTVVQITISQQDLSDFVMKKAADFESILVGDPIVAKDAIRKHIGQLVLKPGQTTTGPVFDVSGDIDLFTGDEDVMQMVPGGGVEPPRPEGRRILSPLIPFANRPTFFQMQRLAIFRVCEQRGPVRSYKEVTGKVRARKNSGLNLRKSPGRQIEAAQG
jgi:site-specific DNA recombinase